MTASSIPDTKSARLRLLKTLGRIRTNIRHRAVNSARATGLVDHSMVATGSCALLVATRTNHRQHQTAGAATTSPSRSLIKVHTPAASPSTVAGATAGAANRLAKTATKLTWPEIAATNGVQPN